MNKTKTNKMQNEKCKMQKSKRGITLIALVITVIVLLILAGVAISLTIDSGGLFSKANEAATSWNRAVAEENEKINEIWNILKQTGGTTPALPEGWNPDAIEEVYPSASATQKAPIPTGYTVSKNSTENTIENGLVIYNINDKTAEQIADIDWTDAETMETLRRSYDQYVWIPVDDIDSMIMCKSSNLSAKTGSITVNGTTTNNTSRCHIELVGGVLKCTNTGHTSTTTDLCGRLYDTTSSTKTVNVDGTNKTAQVYSINFSQTNQTWNTGSYHEPNTVVSDASSDGVTGIKNILNNTTASSYSDIQTAWENELKDNFKYMATSVAKYGGFYISRYEIGANGSSKKGQTVYNAGTDRWYGLYKACRTVNTVGETKHYLGSMIWGSQYDQVLKFIGTEAQEAHPDRYLYSNTSSGTTSGYAPEGNTKQVDLMKNIYDLEANFFEWTASACTTGNRAYRGGLYIGVAYSDFLPASYRYDINPASTSSNYSSRRTLIVSL